MNEENCAGDARHAHSYLSLVVSPFTIAMAYTHAAAPPCREEPAALRVPFGDRLTAVKEVLGDFPGKRQGDRVGLVVFGDAPYGQGKRLPSRSNKKR